MFSVQKLSFTAKGIPSSGPLGAPVGKKDNKARPDHNLHYTKHAYSTQKQTDTDRETGNTHL
jgi:hypothetical protein